MVTLSGRELLEQDCRVEYLIDRNLPVGGAAMIAGAPGEGKSWIGLQAAISVASGVRWLGAFRAKRGPVLVLDEENALPLLKSRVQKLALGMDLDVKSLPISFAIGQGFNLSNEHCVRQLAETIKTQSIGLVVIDSLVRVHRGDENSAQEMAAVMNSLKQFMNQGVSVLLIHHTRKPGQFGVGDAGNSYRGSSDIRAFVDTLLILRRKEQSLALSQEKARWGEAIAPLTIRIGDTPDGGVEVVSDGAVAGAGGNEMDQWILDALANGEVTRKTLIAQAKADGLPQRTVDSRLQALSRSGKVKKLRRVGGETPYALAGDQPKDQVP